ncbi:MAG TPA: hypothetical protein PKN95_03450 [Verrucomicrobiota bacterium]|nr:hypothetical protein [Verrucomicrobiota bacterium]HNT14409.1 hypothetical protein [Verrucomicrobiota bacterium]
MQVIRTPQGLRLQQHGVVISELRVTPGPTHSVFDILAALLVGLHPAGGTGVLGFAGGGMIAPLAALGWRTPLTAVDLDRASYELFCRHCPQWSDLVQWHQAEAATWLRQQPQSFGLLLDDLSIPTHDDVIKPEISWTTLPALMRGHLGAGGCAIFNLVSPPPDGWPGGLGKLAALFAQACVLHLDEFENRLLLAGDRLPEPRSLGRQLQRLLRTLGSRQAGRVHLRRWR